MTASSTRPTCAQWRRGGEYGRRKGGQMTPCGPGATPWTSERELAAQPGRVPHGPSRSSRTGARHHPRPRGGARATSNVAADQIEMPYVRDPDLDTPLTRSAEPVLRSLREQLDGQPVSIDPHRPDRAGADPADRATPTSSAHLDSVLLAPGFSYAEEFVGTNGIGTALEVRRSGPRVRPRALRREPRGPRLRRRADPSPGLRPDRRRRGPDLLAHATPDPLLLTLAKTTAVRIRQALLAETGMPGDRAVQRVPAHLPRMPGIVLRGQRRHGDDERPCPVGARPGRPGRAARQAAEALASGRHGSMDMGLPSGAERPDVLAHGGDGGKAAGGVVHVKLAEAGEQARRTTGTAARMLPLPGLVGSAPLWLRACAEVERVFRRASGWPSQASRAWASWPCCGRSSCAASRSGGSPCSTPPTRPRMPAGAAELRREPARERRQRRHPARRPARRPPAAAAVRRAARGRARPSSERRLWVAVTLRAGADSGELARLLRLFPSTVEVPPLRHAPGGPAGAGVVLPGPARPRRPAGVLAGGAAAADALDLAGQRRAAHQMLRQVVQHRRTGTILPERPAARGATVSRRLLSPLESIERDAIVHSLVERRRQQGEGGAARSACPGRRSTARSTSTGSSTTPS